MGKGFIHHPPGDGYVNLRTLSGVIFIVTVLLTSPGNYFLSVLLG